VLREVAASPGLFLCTHIIAQVLSCVKGCGRILSRNRREERGVRLKELETWLTPAEAGEVAGLSKQGVINYLEDGLVRGVRTHQGWLVDPKDAERLKGERGEASR
jgi:hypothetical protein